MASETPIPKDIQERQRLVKLSAAYKAMFGADPKVRTEMQLLVWEDLQIAGYMKALTFQPDRVGALCPMRAAIAEGRRSLVLYIESQLTYDPSLPK